MLDNLNFVKNLIYLYYKCIEFWSPMTNPMSKVQFDYFVSHVVRFSVQNSNSSDVEYINI